MKQKFMFFCVEHSPVNVQFRCNSFLWLGNQLVLFFFFSPPYPFNIFLENKIMVELNSFSRLCKFINDVIKIMISNVCQHRQQPCTFIESHPVFHFCHNANTQLCHPHCKKYKVLKKLYLPCSCTCSPCSFRYQGPSWQSTSFHCLL